MRQALTDYFGGLHKNMNSAFSLSSNRLQKYDRLRKKLEWKSNSSFDDIISSNRSRKYNRSSSFDDIKLSSIAKI